MDPLLWLLVAVGVLVLLAIVFVAIRRAQRRGDVVASGPVRREGS